MHKQLSNLYPPIYSMKPINSYGFSRRWLGLGMAIVATVTTLQAQTLVTFQVDMTAYGSTPTTVTINGGFNGWAGPALINTSGNIWSNTISIADAPGTVESCKFVADGNYEPLAAKSAVLVRSRVSSDASSAHGDLGRERLAVATNEVTFQLNMNAQVVLGNFIPGQAGQTITVSGDFEGWNDGLPLTNNPTLPGALSNIYTGVFPLQVFQVAQPSITSSGQMAGGKTRPPPAATIVRQQSTVQPKHYHWYTTMTPAPWT